MIAANQTPLCEARFTQTVAAVTLVRASASPSEIHADDVLIAVDSDVGELGDDSTAR